MKRSLTFAAVLLSLTVAAQPARKSVVIGTMTQKPNAILIVNPKGSDQGVLLPQLTTGQRMSLKPDSPAEDGLIVFDTQTKAYFYWSNNAWVEMEASNHATTAFHSIDPIDFKPLHTEYNIRHSSLVVFENDNAFVSATSRDWGEQIIAPVHLPHGAKISELTLYYMDNDNDDIKMFLLRKSHTGDTAQMIAWTSSGASASVKTQTFQDFGGMEAIDLENYTYRMLVEFDLDDGEEIDQASEARQRIYGVKIRYQK